MRNPWRRFRAYVDELDETMRVLGAELDAAERELARDLAITAWPKWHREAARRELVRRALDIPFFADLVREAARSGDLDALLPPDGMLRPWHEGQEHAARLSASPEAPALGADADVVTTSSADAPPGSATSEQVPARVRAAERALHLRTRALVPVLERLVSARNGSAIVRTVDALGLQEVHFIDADGKVDLQSRVSKSVQRYLDVHWHRGTEAALVGLKDRGYHIVCADFGPEATSIQDVALGPLVAVVFGSEQFGVSEAAKRHADALAFIPTGGFASYLNVSVAAGIALYELDRRMRELGWRAPLPDDDLRRLRRAWYAALAGDDPERQRAYLAYTQHPPDPKPSVPIAPGREPRR